ncbi:glutamine synthetase family protein [Escherichia coli]|nr:glutamine synthetase [Escherichia coli]
METNIVEVENFVQQSEERRGSAFTQEVKRYLERYPNTQYVDVLLTDLNGCFRGKRIPVSSLKKLEKGCYFPASVFAMDILGNVVEEAGLGQEMGEPDRTCVPVLGSLTPSAADPEFIGQMLLTMVDEDGAPFDVEPRNVLNRLWQQLRQRGLFPVVAVELEFYLLDRQRDAEGYLQPPCAPGTDDRNTQSQVYSVDNLNHFADVLNDIDELALKRLVRLMAEKHKMHATFMAKPYEEHAGSGMHIHISMQNNRGENVLSDAEGEDSPLLKKMLAGMIDLMPSSMALLAPNVNSYRRFQPGMYVPTQASWGHNNRTVALRIPCGDRHNHRVEYRVAGADANPYLVMAAIFAGILHGLDNALPLQEEVEGNGLEQEGLPFPIRQSDALGEFIENDHLRRYLGERFCHVYHACKNDELLQFERLITETEIEWMLKNA